MIHLPNVLTGQVYLQLAAVKLKQIRVLDAQDKYSTDHALLRKGSSVTKVKS